LTDFLISFAFAIAGLCDLEIEEKPRELWVFEAAENDAADPYSVVMAYGGQSSAGWTRNRDTLSIQIMTRGKDAGATLNRAWQIHDSLFDGGRPRMRWEIAAKKIVSGVIVDAEGQGGGQDSLDSGILSPSWNIRHATAMQVPGIIGRDENQKWMASFNVELAVLVSSQQTVVSSQ
jgi:hypothetical protein